MTTSGQKTLNSSDVIILDDDTLEDNIDNASNKLNDKLIVLDPQKVNDLNNQNVQILNEEKSLNRKRGFCINPRCKSNNKGILKYCPLDILRFYKINVDRNSKQFLCDACFDKAANAIGARIDMLYEGECLHDKKKIIDDELFAISDSDDEDEEGMEIDIGKSEDVDNFFRDNIQSVIEEMFNRLDVAKQVDDCIDLLNEKKNELEEKTDKIDQEIQKIAKFANKVESVYYGTFKKKIENIGEVIIDDVHPERGKLLSPSNTKSPLKTIPPAKPGNSSFIMHAVSSGPRLRFPNVMPQTHPVIRTPQTQPLAVTGPRTTVYRPIRPAPSSHHTVQPPYKPHAGDLCYARKSDSMMSWSRARIVEVISTGKPAENTFSIFKVTFRSSSENESSFLYRQLNGKQMACPTPSLVRLSTGTRVIAMCKDSSMRRDSFFAGIVAEPPLSTNRHRYLIFFDDGYAQYVEHSRIRKIMESSVCVWEDVNKNSAAFIHKYLKNYPERPMVRTEVGHVMRTEYAGSWCKTRVIALDASLVQMYFVDNNRSEWIYRGSTRLAPLYLEIQAADNRRDGKHRPMHIVRKNQNMPYVEYTRIDDDEVWSNIPRGQEEIKSNNAPIVTKQTVSVNKAKKSTTSVSSKNQQLMEPQAIKPPYEGSQGKVIFYRAKTPMEVQKFKLHECNKTCLRTLPYSLKGYSPLSKPLLSGWQRLLVKGKSKKVVVIYRAPCGRRLRNMKELHTYLRLTKCELGVDCFDYDSWVHCLAEFVLERYKLLRDDLSNGMESMPVPCVNYYDHDMPEYSSYSTVRIPTEGVNLNLDEEFLCGCDCEDDCQDKTKCSCWKLTIEGAKCIQPELSIDEIGYQYRRLLEPVTTGIYECNSRCKCSATCLNRVAQRPLQEKLQVFKTKDRGWGIRCMNDLPQGTFICIYAGNLLTEQKANAGGAAYGDEYFAELDYIEVVEKLKEGYEEDVINPELDEAATPSTPDEPEDEEEEEFEDCGSMTRDSDEEFVPGGSRLNNVAATVSTRLSKKKRNSADTIDNNSNGNFVSKLGSEDGKPVSENECSNDAEKLKIKPDPDAQDLESRLASWDLDSAECITISDEEEPLREPSSFAPTDELQQKEEQAEYKSFRLLYGEDEYCYVMDAKTIGNIGRYLNHSCNPNVFVQNVFVDTHDLRFPWVAFFALTFIRAGTELTWNYNYDVNSVPGKVMYCKCGASVCRGRLL